MLDKWAKNQLDGIVATSAFGLGVDKSDVRSVIHASIPETLDRFYQEVGRGGRDGNHSLSFIVFEDSDWDTAKSLTNPKIIGNELGYQRWKELYDSAESRGSASDIVDIDLEHVPGYQETQNQENTYWNLRTLLLIARAELIQMYFHGDTDSKKISIRIKDYNHKDTDHFEKKTNNARRQTREVASKNIGYLKQVLEDNVEISNVLRNLYTLPNNIHPITVCGGCPVCGYESNIDYHEPVSSLIRNLSQKNHNREDFETIFVGKVDLKNIIIFYKTDELSDYLITLLNWLCEKVCLKEFICNWDWIESKKILTEQYYSIAKQYCLLENDFSNDKNTENCWNRLTLRPDNSLNTDIRVDWLSSAPFYRDENTLNIILIPRDTIDIFERKKLVNLETTTFNLADICERIRQYG